MNRIRAYIHDVVRMGKLIRGVKSRVQYTVDRLLVMLLGRIWIPGRNHERNIHLKGEVSIRYRLNRGDIQSLREVWLEQAYKLPIDGRRSVLVDLGANIGMTTIWLARRYGCEKIVAVEPVKANAQLVRSNFDANAIQAVVVEAAIGPSNGTAKFEENEASNQGHIGASGTDVRVICMASLLDHLLPNESVDILKIDIEGGEEALFKTDDLSWLKRVREIIIEFHPTLVDYPGLVSVLKNAGFDYFPAGSMSPDSMDYFRRN